MCVIVVHNGVTHTQDVRTTTAGRVTFFFELLLLLLFVDGRLGRSRRSAFSVTVIA